MTMTKLTERRQAVTQQSAKDQTVVLIDKPCCTYAIDNAKTKSACRKYPLLGLYENHGNNFLKIWHAF